MRGAQGIAGKRGGSSEKQASLSLCGNSQRAEGSGPLRSPGAWDPGAPKVPGCSWVSHELGRAEDPELPAGAQLARLSQALGGKRFSSLVP